MSGAVSGMSNSRHRRSTVPLQPVSEGNQSPGARPCWAIGLALEQISNVIYTCRIQDAGLAQRVQAIVHWIAKGTMQPLGERQRESALRLAQMQLGVAAGAHCAQKVLGCPGLRGHYFPRQTQRPVHEVAIEKRKADLKRIRHAEYIAVTQQDVFNVKGELQPPDGSHRVRSQETAGVVAGQVLEVFREPEMIGVDAEPQQIVIRDQTPESEVRSDEAGICRRDLARLGPRHLGA